MAKFSDFFVEEKERELNQDEIKALKRFKAVLMQPMFFDKLYANMLDYIPDSQDSDENKKWLQETLNKITQNLDEKPKTTYVKLVERLEKLFRIWRPL